MEKAIIINKSANRELIEQHARDTQENAELLIENLQLRHALEAGGTRTPAWAEALREIGAGGDAQFLAEVRRFKHLGYGRMMQIVSHEWYRSDKTGALVVGICYGLLKGRAQREAVDMAEGDVLFRHEATQ